MQVKNILSIDMDIFVWECIELYNNDICRAGANAEKQWDRLEAEKHLDKFLCFDEDLYKKVLPVLCDKVKDIGANNVCFIKDHDGILNSLCNSTLTEDIKYHIYNLDHHHDIYYSGQQKAEVERFSFTNLASWVYYLGYNELLYKYTWLKDIYAKDFAKEQIKELAFPFEQITHGDILKTIEEQKFDKIVICKSPDYLPKKFWDSFDALKGQIEQITGIKYCVDESEYCVDGKSRFIDSRRK